MTCVAADFPGKRVSESIQSIKSPVDVVEILGGAANTLDSVKKLELEPYSA